MAEKKQAAKKAARKPAAAKAAEQAAAAQPEQPAPVRAVVLAEFRDKRRDGVHRMPGEAIEVSPERLAELVEAGERLGCALVEAE